MTGKCECGFDLPCSYHTVTETMREARRALLALNLIQRGLILCWFCPACHEYIGPGESHHVEPGDYGPQCTRADAPEAGR